MLHTAILSARQFAGYLSGAAKLRDRLPAALAIAVTATAGLWSGDVQAQVTGNLALTNVAVPTGKYPPPAHRQLSGGGAALWTGGARAFPSEPNGSGGDGVQTYRGVAAKVQAPPSACTNGTATVTVSVRVTNNGTAAGVGYSGRLSLFSDNGVTEIVTDPTLDHPVGTSVRLTVTGTVPAADVAAGRLVAGLWLETFHTGPKGWTADQFRATYAYANCEADLSITKTDGVTTYTPGMDTSYAIVVSNNGPNDVTGAEISDPLPTGVTSANWTCGNATGGAVCGAPSGTGAINTTANLPSGSSVTYRMSTGISATFSGSLTNTARVAAPAGVTDTNTANNAASDTDTRAAPPVSGACSPIPNSGGAFGPLGATVSVARTGTWNTASPWSTMGGNYSITWTFSEAVPANWIQFDVHDVGGGASYPSTLPSIRVSLGTGGTATTADFSLIAGYQAGMNDLTYAASTGAFGYVRAANQWKAAGGLRGNSADTVKSITITATNIEAGDHIAHALAARPSCVTMRKLTQGGTGAFNFNMANVVQASGAAAPSTTLTTTTAGTAVSSTGYYARPGTAMTLSEVVPAGWSLANAVCTDRNAGATGNPTVIGSLASPTLTIPAANVRPQSDILCVFTNSAATDLSITKDDGQAEYSPGTDVTYTMVVTNKGPTAVTGARITDPLPAGITASAWTCGAAAGGGVCSAASGSGAMDTTADLPVGASVTYAVTMSIPVDFTGDLVNTAAVALPADMADLDPSNNSATDTDKLGDPKVTVKKALIGENITANNVAEPGEVLTYKVTITHTSGPAFREFDFIENIPNGASMTRVSGADGFTAPVAGASTVQLTVPEVPVGGVAEVEIDLTVAAPIPLGISQIKNVVSGGDVPANCVECEVTTPVPPYTPNFPETVSCSTPGAYFNTGFNGTGGVKRSGYDNYWQVAVGSRTGNYGAAAIVTNPPAGPNGWAISPYNNAAWVSVASNAANPAGVTDFFYRYQFNLDPAVDPKSLALQMSYYADDTVAQVWVNGVAQNISASPAYKIGQEAKGILNKGWKTGLNVITIDVKNGGGPGGFMAQITSAAICQPKLTLRKEVINDQKGTLTPADFMLSATGKAPLTNVIQGAMGNAAVTNAPVPPGTYTLAEVNQPGYIASAYSCSIDGRAAQILDKAELALVNGQNAICTIVNDDQDPKLKIEKTGTLNDKDFDGYVDKGETISYSFLVENIGNVPLTGVTVNDDLLARASISVTPGPQTLQPGGKATFTATYTAVQADIEGGQVTNTATATGTPPVGDPVVSEPDTEVVPPDARPVVEVKKELIGENITVNNIAEPGEVLTYKVTLTHVSGAAFREFDFIENIPNGATMTRVEGAGGFTDPVAGASTVQLTVPEVPAGGVAEVEIDLTVAAPIPLGVSQIRNLISGGDVPADCTNCSVTTPIPPYTPVSPPTISCSTEGAYFNTAYNGRGGFKPSGTDDYWEVATTTTNVPGAPPAGLRWGRATVASTPPAGYIKSPFGNANWISHSATTMHVPNNVSNDIFYRFRFNLDPAVDPKSLDLKMSYYADNSVFQVWVNGAAQNIRSNFGTADPYFYAGFYATGVAAGSMNGAWKVGANEIIVHVKSGAPAQAFMGQISAGAICQPKLTLRKEVINDNGGTATPVDFPLSAAGKAPLTTVIQGAMGAPAITNAPVPEGTYTLAETTRPDYVPSLYSCSIDGGAAQILDKAELALVNGQNAICTIYNDDQDPKLTIKKTGALNDKDGDGLLDLGETIAYTFEVKNTGNVTLTGVTVNDPLVKVTEAPQTLAPGGIFIFHGTYTPDQADIDAGQVENTATATGTPPAGDPIESDHSTEIIPPDVRPSLKIVKTGKLNDTDGDKLLDPGETITYSFEVENDGEVTLDGVTVDDSKLAAKGIGVTPGPQKLAPGDKITFTATAEYEPSQAELDAGQVENVATATGKTPKGADVVSPEDPEMVPPDLTPGLEIEKTGKLNDKDADGKLDSDETITYTFLVRNTGNVTLANVTVDDPMLAARGMTMTPEPQTLAPNAEITFTATPDYVPTQADIDAGQVKNVATASGVTPGGVDFVSEPDDETVPPDLMPGLTIVKTPQLNDADGDGLLDLNETVTYSFLVTNTGKVTLSGVTVNDPMLAAANVAISPEPQTLAPGGKFTFTSAIYTPDQADIDAGFVKNTATATGTPPTGDPVVSDPSEATVNADVTAALTLVKSAAVSGDDALYSLGETVTYSFTVKNAGKVTLSDVTVNDPMIAAKGMVLAPASYPSVLPGETVSFTATYQPVQADIDAGRIDNVATASAKTPDNSDAVSEPSAATINADVTAALTLVKSAAVSGDDALYSLGETVTYSFTVKNAGKVTLSDVTVNDPMIAAKGMVLTPASYPSVLPGETVSFTATYQPDQADIDAGRIDNVATASAKTPDNSDAVSEPSAATINADVTASLTLVKSAAVDGDDALYSLGETVTYSFTVKNEGKVTLSDVTVNDPMIAAKGMVLTPANYPAVLPGETVSFTATYQPDQADIDAGRIDNVATASAKTPDNSDAVSEPSAATINADVTAALTLQKSAAVSGDDALYSLGETVTYSFTVKNAGKVTLSDVTVNDPMIAAKGMVLTPANYPSVLPGETVSFTATYQPVQADIDAGRIDNVATASAKTPDNSDAVSEPSAASVNADVTAALTLQKSAAVSGDDALYSLGETVTYSFTVRNAGKVTLSDVTVNDPMIAAKGMVLTPASYPAVLPGETVSFTATYQPDQADIDAGRIDNVATASAKTPDNGDAVSEPSAASVEADVTASLTLQKSAAVSGDDALYSLGETVTYSFTVKNAGKVTLSDVTVNDPMIAAKGMVLTPASYPSVLPGETVSFTATYQPDQADIDAGRIDNVATASAKTPDNSDAVSEPSAATINADVTAALTLQKSAAVDGADALYSLGETVTYSFTVKNAGKVTLSDVTVNDP
ncbi:DUF7507 domain-containing protein, partial [Phyllobacterium leguminum]